MYNWRVMNIKDTLSAQIVSVLKDLGIAIPSVLLSYSAGAAHGDLATNIALMAAKEAKKNPLTLAEEIVAALNNNPEMQKLVKKVEVVKPGFINFWIADEVFTKQLEEIIATQGNIIPQTKEGQQVVVEYSSPNIAKPFTIGHLRSTIIGDAVANLLQAAGATVHRDNHVGDWGTQFGKQIYAIKTWGDEEAIERSERPVKELVALYVKFHEEAEKDPKLEDAARLWFKKLEDGDSEARTLWKKCIAWSWKEFAHIYELLGVQFTENEGKGYGESYFEDKMAPVVAELEQTQLLKESEDAKLVFFSEEQYPPLMILKKDGSTLYSTRDLATDKFRREKYGKEVVVINEVGSEQSLYFEQLFKVEEMLGWYRPEQRVHIKHGMYRFKDGKMSTRKGNVIWLEDVLAEATKKAEALAGDKKEVAQQVGIGALKWNDLKRTSQQDIVFNWEDILNMEGNSGPYLQYSFARTQSVLRKSDTSEFQTSFTSISLHPEERELLRLLSQFSDVVEEAASRYAPNILCTYLFELAQAFNTFYQKCPILKEEEAIKQFRLSLTAGTGMVLKKGLNLLGIQAPERM